MHPELVGVLVDEAHSDVVVGGDLTRRPQTSRTRFGSRSALHEPHPQLDRQAVGDLVGQCRDRIVRSVIAVECGDDVHLELTRVAGRTDSIG